MRELVRAVERRRRGADRELARFVLDAAAGPPKAAERVLDGLAEATPRTWLRLDVALRSWWQYGESGRDGAGALGALVAACSGDGRRREAALGRACMETDRRLLPILVIRTADWVRPVRERAQTALARALDGPAKPPTLAGVGVALEMRDWSRGQHANEVMGEALRYVPGARSATHLPTRRLAYELWFEDEPQREDLVQAVLTETDPVSRLRCAELLAQDQDVDALQRLLETKAVPVQVVALTGLVTLGRPEHGLPFLTVGSSPLRATAQWAARRAGVDPAVRYREAEGGGPRGRVAGLGECGTAGDLGLVEPYFEHERPRVRAEAVRAFHRLGGPAARLAPMFVDPAPVVVRAVSRALRGESVLPTRRLRHLLADPGRPRHVRRAAFALSAARGSWPRVEAALLLLLTDDPELAALGQSDLGAWLRSEAARNYGVPSPEARRRVRELLAAASPVLGDDRARTVRWYLGIDG
ncbi:hypothetical protein [Actinomadura sp. WMMB 499]|uniref:hypothetical protein n=1 Tax=Actinomadura sp. WMMB 499 TaxID=1219491 RepID=UPI001246CC4D|nr:hypothetical protein [Actinomadura sp. WMMB 499]QFG23145.1 hypothetical protein F7P10_20480 [Actinomadura sp. WMMB 499]